MHTALTLHGQARRHRFAEHLAATLGGLVPPVLRHRAATQAAPSAALEAQQVRDLAQGYLKTDPGFAADLFAAAARHEQLADD